jgi:hypothetical protein
MIYSLRSDLIYILEKFRQFRPTFISTTLPHTSMNCNYVSHETKHHLRHPKLISVIHAICMDILLLHANTQELGTMGIGPWGWGWGR